MSGSRVEARRDWRITFAKSQLGGGENLARFPYFYYDIYRSTQDVDLALDGSG
ncbi:MAG: hypothetical protein H7301_03700 [Cryobacterium sp.]|nr:hypothetical protein [Oligoflexia bacterium]